jgi:hypothetical protein
MLIINATVITIATYSTVQYLPEHFRIAQLIKKFVSQSPKIHHTVQTPMKIQFISLIKLSVNRNVPVRGKH